MPDIDETEETYDPTTVEVDRARQQGLGMGEKDLQRQRDPGDGLGPGEAHLIPAADEDEPDGALGRAQPVS